MTRTPFSQLDTIVRSLLRDSIPRAASTTLEFAGTPRPAGIEAPEERAVAAVGTLLVWKLIQHGGSSLPVGPAAEAAQRLLDTFPDTDRRRVETEAVEILRWLEDSLNLLGDDWKESDERGMYPWEDRQFPDNGKMSLIQRALDERLDLELEYFTYRRNCFSRRRVTPLEIEDDKILRARCHWRQEERSFAIHRIKEARLVATQS